MTPLCWLGRETWTQAYNILRVRIGISALEPTTVQTTGSGGRYGEGASFRFKVFFHRVFKVYVLRKWANSIVSGQTIRMLILHMCIAFAVQSFFFFERMNRDNKSFELTRIKMINQLHRTGLQIRYEGI